MRICNGQGVAVNGQGMNGQGVCLNAIPGGSPQSKRKRESRPRHKPPPH